MKKMNFIEERNRRLSILSEKQLWREVVDKVRINEKPVSYKVARSTFNVEDFNDLKGPQLRVWLASDGVIAKYEENLELYGDKQN